MKTGFYRILLGTVLLLLLGSAGCGRKQNREGGLVLFYVNAENTKTVSVPYEPEKGPEAMNPREMIADMLDRLSKNPDSLEYKRPLTGDIELMSWSLEGGQLQLTFSSDYSQMDNVTEVLCRAAYVRTLMQVKGVEYISFSVGDAPLLDAKGNPVGLMTAESFIENPGEQINSIQTAKLTLYFSNEAGDGLVQEVQECHYSSNISQEKLVMERLLAGPLGTEGRATIPAGTKLVSVSVLDGVCFVNLDNGFLTQNFEIAEGVVIYSIVNSLAELPNINKVQLSVNGDTSSVYRENFSFGTVYERNLDYLSTSQKSQEDPEAN